MDEFFAAIEAGNASAVRTFLERDASLANAVKVLTPRPEPNQEEDPRCGSGLPRLPEPVKPVKARPPFTRTALQIAVRHKHLDIVRLLLEFGADVNATGGGGLTALLYAMLSDHPNLDLVRVLLEAGADVNARDGVKYTPLHRAFRWDRDALPVVELLLTHGADVKACDGQGRTPLGSAVLYLACPGIDHVRLIEILLRFGARPSPPRLDERDAEPALCEVVRSGNARIARMLVEAGADVNASDRWGTPLHRAAERGLDQIVELLLQAGADPSVRDPEGRTALDMVEPLEEMANYYEQWLEQP
jgi:ankyrin repeat protein